MYSTVGILRQARQSGKLMGTHQQIDRVAMKWLRSLAGKQMREAGWPTTAEILYFEGSRGPDGLKWKSPGVDEPMHFIIPDQNDGKLIKILLDHQYNLRRALEVENRERAAFEAAWLAHAVTDGLTPAHHFPYEQAVGELMSEREYVEIFGRPVKGVMPGENWAEKMRNNWLYWGARGYMTKHVAFEYGVALVARTMGEKALRPKLTKKETEELKRRLAAGRQDRARELSKNVGGNEVVPLDLTAEFMRSLERVDRLKMYERFRETGWTTELGRETRMILLPEIVRCVAVAWGTCL